MSLLRGPHLLLGAAILLHGWALWWLFSGDTPAPEAMAPPTMIDLPAPRAEANLAPALGGRLFYGGAGTASANGSASIDASAAPIAPLPPPPPVPTLAGTATARGRSAVAILRGPSGVSRMLRTGESLDGWRVTAIRPGAVTVRNGDETRTLAINAAASGPSDIVATSHQPSNANGRP